MAIIQKSIDTDVPGRQFIVVPHQVVVDIDYDCISERIYWSDIAGYSIRSSTSNGTDVKTIFKDDLKSPEGIAIDYASRNIYYVDSLKDEIGVITIDGKYQKALLTEGLVNPRALAIDLDNRKLYYRLVKLIYNTSLKFIWKLQCILNNYKIEKSKVELLLFKKATKRRTKILHNRKQRKIF